jgi:protein O-mannosyl-transferase
MLCAAVGILVYINSLSGSFVYDDLVYVQRNPQIRSIGSVSFFSPFSSYAPGLYRPMTNLSYAIDYSVFELNPFGYHVSNVLLHAVASGLVFVVLFLLVGNFFAAIASGILFASHPIHTEAVSWVSGRSEILACIFVLLSFIYYLRGNVRWSAMFYFFGLLAKEVAAPLIFILPLIGRRKIKDYVPYAISLFAYLALRVMALGGLSVPMEHIRTAGLSLVERMLMMITVIVHYMKLMIWPLRLRVEYDWVSFPAFITIVSIFIIAAIIYLLIKLYKENNKLYFLCGIWFFLFLLPVSNIIPIGEFVAERFLYLPSVGICFLAGLLINDLFKNKTKTSVLLMIVVIFSGLSIVRNSHWRSPEVLWENTLELSPNAPHALQNLAGIRLAQGKLDEAQDLISHAIRNWSDEPVLYFISGQVYEGKGNNEKAGKMYAKSIELSIEDKHSMTESQKGVAYIKLDRTYEALESLEKAKEENPYDASIWNNLGIVYAYLGKYEDSLAAFDRAIELYEKIGLRSAEEEKGYNGAIANRTGLLEAIEEL